jgi:hypothetical protein
MPQVDVADDTWIAASPDRVAEVVADPVNWHRWWPDFDLEVDQLRGSLGARWFVSASDEAPGPTGSMEVWLEPCRDGVVLHYFLRLAVPERRGPFGRNAQRAVLGQRRRAKRNFWALKDDLEGRTATGRETQRR